MTEDEARKILVVLATSWPQRELSKPERELWMHDLAQLRLDDATAALMVCRRSFDWLPTAHQFAEAYISVVTSRIDAERDQRRALAEASIVPAPPEVRKRAMAEIRQKLAGARGPLAAGLRAEFDL